MAKFRGITWNNSRFGAKIIVRRSIDIAEMGDFGSITSDADDLPTRGAVHRADESGSTSGTRNYLDLRGIAGQYSNVVDTQDMGLISDATTTHRVWSSTGAISDISSTAPTTLDNPSPASYAVSVTSSGQSVSSVTEGQSLNINVETQNVADGTQLTVHVLKSYDAGYTDPYILDFNLNGSTSTTATVTINNNSATISSFSVVADSTTETGNEAFKVYLSTDGTSSTFVANTAWISISDTSQSAPDLTQYNWAITTSVDIANAANDGNGNYYLMSSYSDPSTTAQMVEGSQQTYTITTNAPDGTQVFIYMTGVYMGSYNYNNDPSGNYAEFYSSPYGWVTVQNGQITGSLEPISDGYTEDGEVKQLVIKDSSSWSSYNQLAESQWFHLLDSGSSTGSGSSSTVWSPPTSGETFTGGESVFDSGSPQGEWFTAADSATGNARIRIRMHEGTDTDLRRDISYVLDNLSSGDLFYVGTTGMLVTGNISKNQLSPTSEYYDYYFDVNTQLTNSTYFYEFTVVA